MSIPLLLSHIGGVAVQSQGSEATDDINPSDVSDVLARVPRGAPEDVQAAVAAARDAFRAWRALPGPDRAQHLYNWAGVIAGRADELARAIMREVGKPIGEARGEVGRCSVILRYYAGEAVRANGELIPAAVPGALQFSLQEPLGVVGLVTPWNFPLAIPLWKAAPALAFGNTVVLKPAEAASFCATLLAETCLQAGLPKGVFNVVLGDGAIVGDALVRHPDVRGISFTGSSAVGSRVAQSAAARNAKFQTEMGGKNVVIVAADADLDHAAMLTANGAMRYAGQKCTATSRVIVESKVEDAFLDRLRAHVEGLELGPVDRPTAAIGPLISARARESVAAAVAGAGSVPWLGGGIPDGDYSTGFFYRPTILRDVDPASAVATEELFGPVLVSMRATDLDHAISLANGVRYGLSASMMTRDIRTALRYVHAIDAGLVRVNADTTGVDPHAPFGGMKGSSSGSREQGSAAHAFYTETKTVQINP